MEREIKLTKKIEDREKIMLSIAEGLITQSEAARRLGYKPKMGESPFASYIYTAPHIIKSVRFFGKEHSPRLYCYFVSLTLLKDCIAQR